MTLAYLVVKQTMDNDYYFILKNLLTGCWAFHEEWKVSDPEKIKPFITNLWFIRIVLHKYIIMNLCIKNQLAFSNALLCVRRGNGMDG